MTGADKPLPAWIAMAATAFGAVAAQVAGMVASIVAIGALLALGGSSASADIERAAKSFAVLAASGLAVGATLLCVAAGTVLAVGARPREALGLGRASAGLVVAATLGTFGLGPSADLVMTWFASLFPNLTFGTVPQLNELARVTSPFWLWPVLALAPGLCEELFFRGMLQRALGRGALAVAVSAVAFSLIHLDPHHVAGVLPLGFWLAWVAARADSTWPTIVAHIANNTLALLATRVDALDRGHGGSAPMPWYWAPAGLVVTLSCALAILRATRATPDGARPSTL